MHQRPDTHAIACQGPKIASSPAIIRPPLRHRSPRCPSGTGRPRGTFLLQYKDLLQGIIAKIVVRHGCNFLCAQPAGPTRQTTPVLTLILGVSKHGGGHELKYSRSQEIGTCPAFNPQHLKLPDKRHDSSGSVATPRTATQLWQCVSSKMGPVGLRAPPLGEVASVLVVSSPPEQFTRHGRLHTHIHIHLYKILHTVKPRLCQVIAHDVLCCPQAQGFRSGGRRSRGFELLAEKALPESARLQRTSGLAAFHLRGLGPDQDLGATKLVAEPETAPRPPVWESQIQGTLDERDDDAIRLFRG